MQGVVGELGDLGDGGGGAHDYVWVVQHEVVVAEQLDELEAELLVDIRNENFKFLLHFKKLCIIIN